jgi:hypothetical protein
VITAFATAGAGSGDEARIAALIADLPHEIFAFDRSTRASNVPRLLAHLRRTGSELLVMEGTGLAGGVGALLSHHRLAVPYVVSSGDATGPFLAHFHPAVGPIARRYERVLLSRSAGFIGWTPYLVGRAFALGARRGITAAGWAPAAGDVADGAAARERLGIDPGALVLGIAGTLIWDDRPEYCYGLELVRAVRATSRPDVIALIIGEGSGLERLRTLAGEDLGTRILLPGAVAREEVGSYLAAMDAGSLPQSVDEVGALRYTTKISEYLAAGLPIITGQIPLAYDLDDGWLWRLPGDAPWSARYVDALTRLVETLSRDEAARRAAAVPRGDALFDAADQRRRVSAFLREIIDREQG